MTLAEALRGRNAISALRLVLAATVVLSHSWFLTDRGTDPLGRWTRGALNLGDLAVGCFFFLSGVLVTRSWQRIGSVPRYAWHRALRLLPGFWVCLLVTAGVLAPIAWWAETGHLAGYYSISGETPLGYVYRNGLLEMRQYGVAGTLRSEHFGQFAGYWDGSLWTLIYEAKCYLLVAVLGVSGVLRRPRVAVAVTALWFAALVLVEPPASGAHRWTGWWDIHFAELGGLFLLGTLAQLYSDVIRIEARWAAAAAAFLGVSQLHAPRVVSGVCVGYLVCWALNALPWKGIRTDLSYGVYVYGAPVQQLLVLAGLRSLPPPVFAVIALVPTVGLAALSWRLVESPALRLKHLGLAPARARPGTGAVTAHE